MIACLARSVAVDTLQWKQLRVPMDDPEMRAGLDHVVRLSHGDGRRMSLMPKAFEPAGMC